MDDLVELREDGIFLLGCLLKLRLGNLELLFQLFDILLLIFFAIVYSGQSCDQVFDLLLFVDEVTGKLELPRLELFWRNRLDYRSSQRKMSRSVTFTQAPHTIPSLFLGLQFSYGIAGPELIEVVMAGVEVDASNKLLSKL